jgi:hypothetical protein
MSRYAYDKDTKQSRLIAGVGTGQGGILPHLIIISEAGSDVTVTKDSITIVALETSTGHFECDVPENGTYHLDDVLGGEDARVSVVLFDVKVYTIDDSHFHADITVTYPTGAQVSCSKSGETTLYATGSPYTFTVHSAGTWTITGIKDGVTVTKNVTISTSGQTENISFIHTVTVDLYSATSDTVSFTDATGNKIATTDVTGKAENVNIMFTDFAPSITFTSSVAKDPDNLSNDYSKTITVTDATTDVYVMPDNVIYWYGYEEKTLVAESGLSITRNTNSITTSVSAPPSGVNALKLKTSETIDITNLEYYNIIVNSASISNYSAYSRISQYIGVNGHNIVEATPITSPTLKHIIMTDLSVTGNQEIGVYYQVYANGGVVQLTFNALWLE